MRYGLLVLAEIRFDMVQVLKLSSEFVALIRYMLVENKTRALVAMNAVLMHLLDRQCYLGLPPVVLVYPCCSIWAT